MRTLQKKYKLGTLVTFGYVFVAFSQNIGKPHISETCKVTNLEKHRGKQYLHFMIFYGFHIKRTILKSHFAI